MDVGALIRTTRETAGISQRELAQRAGTSQAAVAKIEAGKTSPTVRTVDRLMGEMNRRVELTGEWIDSGVDRTQIAGALLVSPEVRLSRAASFARSVMQMQKGTMRKRK